MDLGLNGRTALITGADSGIGWHTAKLLLAEGAKVAITDLDSDELTHAAQALDVADDRLVALPADVTGAQGKFHEIDEEGWRSTLDIDLMGPVRVLREFLDDLRTGGWGRVVLLASEDGVQPYDDEIPYCTAKAGVLALAKGLSRTYAREGLLVNAVSPAFIHTPMTDTMMNKRSKELGVSFDEAIESFLDQERPYMELKRRGEPEEVAAVIAFLCSDKASFVNGSNYRVDSGSVATF